jgi:hypothetical protein
MRLRGVPSWLDLMLPPTCLRPLAWHAVANGESGTPVSSWATSRKDGSESLEAPCPEVSEAEIKIVQV